MDEASAARISLPKDDLSRPLEATSGRAFGITPVLLQFRQTISSAEIRAGSSDTGNAGGIDRKAANVTSGRRGGISVSPLDRSFFAVCLYGGCQPINCCINGVTVRLFFMEQIELIDRRRNANAPVDKTIDTSSGIHGSLRNTRCYPPWPQAAIHRRSQHRKAGRMSLRFSPKSFQYLARLSQFG